MLLTELNHLYLMATAVLKNNQFLMAGLGIYGVSLITYLVKDIPLGFFNYVKRQSTTTLTINNHDQVFFDFLKIMEDATIISLVRNWNFNNGKSIYYTINESPQMSVGYGITYAIWQRKPLIINRYKVDASQTTESKETIEVICFGRTRKTFLEIFNEIQKLNTINIEDNDKISIFIFSNSGWIKSCESYKRSMDSVVLPNKDKNTILNHIDNFKKNKDWYQKNGIPYRTGIVLEGPPGTGKTSLVKALASHMNIPLYYIDATECGPGSIKEALRMVPDNGLVVIEEIDRMLVPFKKEEHPLEEKSLTGGEILNAIDGILGSENRILVITTNHVEKLDRALIREGRFDLKIHVGYMTDETLRSYIERMYPDFKEAHLYNVKENIAPCLVQKLIFDHKNNVHEVLNKVSYRNDIENNEFQTSTEGMRHEISSTLPL